MSENLWDVELLIEGRWSPASSGRTFITTSNVTGKPIATVAAATLSDVDRAVDAAADAMDEWAATNPAAGHVTQGDIDRLQQSPPINFASAWMNMWAKVFGSVRLMKALLVPTN